MNFLFQFKSQDMVWLILMVLTLGNAFIAESVDPSFFVTLVIASSIAIKGCLVIDRFMEMRNAHSYIRFFMNIYFIILPIMIIGVYLFPDRIAEMTRL